MPRTHPRKRERTRAALLDAALDLFARQGYEATTIEQIARAADVARQTVLNHFPRKEAFVLAWGERRRSRITDIPPDAATARDRLHAGYRALARANEQERDLTRALHPHYQVIAVPAAVPDAVLAAIRAGQDSGELNAKVDPVTAGQILTAVYFDTLTRWLLDEDPAPLAAQLADRVTAVLDGLAAEVSRCGSRGAGSSSGARSG